jgi:DNA-binding NarL/FixJ family response regulator
VTEPIRVVIADDHPLFRDGLRTMLADHDGLECVGEAATGDEVLACVRDTRPDVVLRDLQMPGLDGIEATRRVVSSAPGTAVLALTMFDDDRSVDAALRAGARGYLLKGATQAELVRAIESVAGGQAILAEPIAGRVLDRLTRPAEEPETLFPELTAREREVLRLVAEGAPNGRIGRQLGITEKTVRNHLSNILLKLQVTDRTQAALRAREAGLA